MNRACWLVSLVLAPFLVSSCASITVDKLPLPGMGSPNGHEIVVEFTNILNLPERANVMLNGTTVGVVTKVANNRDFVEVTARIDPSIEVPANVHAGLQQATMLGDTYVSLDRPPGGEAPAPPLEPGGRIPLAHTTAPPQLEDTIANLATFVTSGSIQRVQRSITDINRVMPHRDQIRKISSQAAADLSDLSKNLDQVDTLLASAAETVDIIQARIPDYLDWLSPYGLRMWNRMFTIATYINTGLMNTGSVYTNGYWLVPMLNSIADAMGGIQHSKWSFETEWPAWRELLTDALLPVDKHPAINITSIVGPDGRELSENMHDVLRILGATP